MKKLLVIGAGFLQTYVIRKAKEMGYFVLAIDGNPKAPGFAYADKFAVVNIVDEQACLQYAKQEGIHGVLTAATDYGVLSAAYVAKELGLRGLTYEVAQTVKNKYLTRKCLFENQVDDTKQAYEVSRETDTENLANHISYPVMVKPCDGSGSRGASRVDSAEEFVPACRQAMEASLTGKATVETFVVGREYGAESLVVDGEVHVLAVMQKWMTQPPYYAELGHAIPTDLSAEVEEKARACVEKAIRALGINFGSVNMDMLITPNGDVHIVDIGVRMGGNLIGSHIVPLGTGVDYMGAMIQNAVGDPVDLTARSRSAVATKLLAFSGGEVKRLPDIKEMETQYDVRVEHHIHIGDCVNEYHTNLDGCGYVIATAKTAEEAAKRAERARAQIEQEIF